MNFAADIVLDDADGTDITYRRVGTSDSGSKWIDIATNLSAPAFMEILHSTSGKGADAIDRHLVRFTRTVVDASSVPRTLTVNFTLAVPRSVAITSQIVYDQVSNLMDLLSNQVLTTVMTDTGAVASLLRGES